MSFPNFNPKNQGIVRNNDRPPTRGGYRGGKSFSRGSVSVRERSSIRTRTPKVEVLQMQRYSPTIMHMHYEYSTPYCKPLVSLTRFPEFHNENYKGENPYSKYADPNRPPFHLRGRPTFTKTSSKQEGDYEEEDTDMQEKFEEQKEKTEDKGTTEEKDLNSDFGNELVCGTMNGELILTQGEREVNDLSLRYPQMYIPMDFTKIICHWQNQQSFPILDFPYDKEETQIVIDNITGTYFENIMGELLPQGDFEKIKRREDLATLDTDSIKHNAKVMFGSMEANHTDPSKHFFNNFRFIVGKREKSELFALGGSWVKDLDGPNPMDDATLRNTACRCVMNFCGLDLKPSLSSWVKFVEVLYYRPSEVIDGESYPEMMERTVIFLVPNVSSLFPTVETYPAAKKMREDYIQNYEKNYEKNAKDPSETQSIPQSTTSNNNNQQIEEKKTEKKEEGESLDEIKIEKKKESRKALIAEAKLIPKDESMYIVTRKEELENKSKLMKISLEGLLDYNLNDRHEKTFECSVFAECFKEMVQLKNSMSIFNYLNERVFAHNRKKKSKDETKIVNPTSTTNTTKEEEIFIKEEKEEEEKEKKEKKERKTDSTIEETKEEGKGNKKEQISSEEKDISMNEKESKTEVDFDEEEENTRRMRATWFNNLNNLNNSSNNRPSVPMLSELTSIMTDKKIRSSLAPNYETTEAFKYFDKSNSSKIPVAQVESLLLSMGVGLSKNQVSTLVSSVVPNDQKDSRYINYSDLPQDPADFSNTKIGLWN